MPDVISIASGADVASLQRIVFRNLNLAGAIGQVNLGPVPSQFPNKVFDPLICKILIQAPQAITTAPIVSIGTVSPWTDVVALTTLTGAAGGKGFLLPLNNPYTILTPGMQVKGNLSQAAISAGAVVGTLIVYGNWL